MSLLADKQDSYDRTYREQKRRLVWGIFPAIADLLMLFLILLIATGISYLCWHYGITQDSIIAVYILGVFLTSVMTKSYGCSIIQSFASVMLFNFLFTEPRFTFHAKEIGYLFTFVIMLIVSLLTATLANKLKRHARESAQAAYRTRILLETNQLLQKGKDDFEEIRIATNQLLKLLGREVIFFYEENGSLSNKYVSGDHPERDRSMMPEQGERKAAEWVYQNMEQAGCGTVMFPEETYLYLPVCINRKVFGVVGVRADQVSLDSDEIHFVHSILSECALAIENNRNAKEKEDAAVLMKNEQLRANILRSISHDLRTPLTTISGNVDALISDGNRFDADAKKQMLIDIYDEAIWLNKLVENLLSVTRIEEGRMNLHTSAELVEEVIQEALRHVKRNSRNHRIRVTVEDDLMLARMDSRLIVQVIINLVDNAIKHTPEGSDILISAKEDGKMIRVSVADTGTGIPEAYRSHIFEMFFTGENKVADGHRSLGLGLALCKSIVTAHGGEIECSDQVPRGSVFTFTLPKEEVNLHE